MPTVKRLCGCKCNGCIENKANHCLQLPCKRQRNRRTKAEWDKAPRHPGGELKDTPAERERRLLREMSTPRKRKELPSPPQRVIYPFLAKAPSGKVMNLYGSSELERENMMTNLRGYGYECVSGGTGLGVDQDSGTEDGGQSS